MCATYSGLRIDVAGTDKQFTTTSTNGLTSALSSVFTVNPAAANKLVIVTPPSSTATVGMVFDQQPVIWIEDTYNNLRTSDTLTVTAARLGGAGTLQGTTAIAAVGGVASFSNLSHLYATNITIQFTASGVTAATSGTIAVSPNTYSQLLVLLPGETAAPATTTGKTGTPTAQVAGTAFAARVSAVDANWNLISTVTDTVGITSSDTTATLPASAALINGTNSYTVTLKDADTQTLTATGTQTGISSAITVNAGTFTKLQLLMPGETAAPGTTTGKTGSPSDQTAGTAFTVTVNAVDANWNLVSSTHTIAITSSDANATLPSSAALVAGTKTFSVTFKTAGSRTVTATDSSDGTKTANTSPSTTVNVGAFAKLQLLVPGETAAPGTSTGKTGTPSAQTVGNLLNVTVNAVDANWNLVNTVTDTIGITSTDANASLEGNTPLSGGTGNFTVIFQTAGSRTVTATDASDGSKTANTSPSITVGVGAFAMLQVLMPGETAAPGTTTGKTGTPTVQTAGTAFTATVRSVDASWNLVSTTHTVHIASSDAQATLPANAALSAGSGSFSVTFKTTASQTVTASDVTTSDPLDSNTGTATTVNPAAASKLVIATPPSSTATAGVPFTQQPVIYIEDTYNNIRSNDNAVVVTATRSAGAGILQGTTNVTAVGGVVTYTDLAHGWATNITIQFTSMGLTSATSGTIAVNPGDYSRLLVLAPGQTNAPGTRYVCCQRERCKILGSSRKLGSGASREVGVLHHGGHRV